MAHYKLREIGDAYVGSGYKVYMDEAGEWYSGWVRSGELELLRTLASLTDDGERDMPIFTKEFCEYQGYKREQYDTVEFI